MVPQKNMVDLDLRSWQLWLGERNFMIYGRIWQGVTEKKNHEPMSMILNAEKETINQLQVDEYE